MEINIEDNFALLFDKNNNTAYKALQMLQKECAVSYTHLTLPTTSRV